MSFRLVSHTPTIGAAPGETVIGRVEIHNDGTTDAVYTVKVVGLATDAMTETLAPAMVAVPVPGGSSATADISIVVPRMLGIGQHAAAFEATSSRGSDRAALTPFTVSIQSVSRVDLTPQPSTIRARRRASFHLDVTNNEDLPVDVTLVGEAPDVDISFTPAAMSLQPGQRGIASGKVRGPRHLSGEPTQHNILITARGRASSTSVTAAYVQRPLFAHRLRMVVAAVTVIALWLGAIGGVALWWSNRDEGTDAAAIVGRDLDGDGIPDAFVDADGRPVTATDSDGDGIPDTFVDADGNPITGTDTNGDGLPDTLVDADGKPLKAIDTNGDGVPDTLSNGAPLPDSEQPVSAAEPRPTILRGTVEIDGDPSSVAIALTPLELGAAPSPTATPIGLRTAQPVEPDGKIWSARATTMNDLLGSATRRTQAIEPDATVPGPDGVWLFTDVMQGQSYEVSFSSPGFDTQSYVLTPLANGDPIELDVTMKPSNGSLSGTVVGPDGPLGGAEIQITDGTLDFATTSASGSGNWSLDGVSTPGIYTITATLRGFATAVRQIELGPGDTPTGITLQMVQGLGTITGRVTTGGAGLGGVTVTASNGETTLTTTTLTEGNIGFYSLPQLAVPATYTVQAELEGYVTDSLRVPLANSVRDVDFAMISTTTTLSGRVLSSSGGGIESAGLIISTGELQFRASTSPTGAFSIDRLPPGDYTITAEHFQHNSVTEFTTLTAGAPPTPLQITLPRSSGPPAVGTGSLVVSVVNDDPTIRPVGINNAKVTIQRTRTTEFRTLQDPAASAVTFDNLPIGTYTISVEADGYNRSVPVTKSVGQTRERAEVELQRLGQASGSMINSLDPTRTPLPGYAVTLYRLINVADPVGIPVGTFTDTAGEWTTPDTALPTGLYRIEATSPDGFLVRNDQILDTSPLVAGRAMTFVVPQITDAAVKPLILPPIEADPYPTITGKIYKPRLNGAAVEYDAIDDRDLKVTGTCNGKAIPTASIRITDAFGNSNPPTNDQFDTFSISKEAVAAAIPTTSLPGACTFTVTAPGRVDATIDLANVVPSDGLTPSNRLAAAALVTTPTTLTGTVFWFDRGDPVAGSTPGERRPLGNVNITTATPTITGFLSTEASAVIPDPRPVAKLDVLSTTSNATTGRWTLNGQAFGVTPYTFTTPNFAPGSVPITISETARTIPSSGSNLNTFNDAGGDVGIELAPPNPGTITGRVTIQTTSTRKYGTNMVRATPPFGSVRTETPNASGDFTFANAVAGTWRVNFDPLPNHVREPFATQTVPAAPIVRPLDPGGSLTGVDATFTELATVRVELFDASNANAPIALPARLTLTTPTPVSNLTGDIPERQPAAPNASNVYELAGIPVSRTTPVTTPVNYSLAVGLADFDLARATVSINGAPASLQDARTIPLAMVAGRVTEIEVYVTPFRAIRGSIVGLRTGASSVPLPLSGPADLQVLRVGGLGGDPAPRVEEGATPGSFVIIGAPGTYEITPSHPNYELFPTETVLLGSGADVPLSAFQLTLRPSKLTVNAVQTLASGIQVTDAVFDAVLGASSCSGFPATTTSTPIVSGPATIDVEPGTYCVAINKFDSPADPALKKRIAFPAIVIVTVPTSTATEVSTTTVIAPLPSLRPTVTGTLVAENANSPAQAVQLFADPPPAAGPRVTSAFTQNVNVSVNATTVPNLNPNSTGSREAFAALTTCATEPCPWEYSFTDMPAGTNVVTAPVIPGYTLVTGPQTVPVSETGPTTIPPFVYRLANAPVEIALGPGTFPSLDTAFSTTDTRVIVTLKRPNGAVAVTGTQTFDATTNTLVINGVAPEPGNWTVEFDDVLHELFSDDKVNISQKPNADGRFVATLKKDPVGDRVRLTGTATEQSTVNANSIQKLSGNAVMTLVGASTYRLFATPDATNVNSVGARFVNNTTYIFDVPAAGTYTLTTTKTDFAPRALANLPLADLGTVLGGQNVAIQKLATVTVRALNRGLALPPGLRVDLLNVSDLSVYGPTALPTTPATNPTVTFTVPAGTYRARTIDNRSGVPTYPQQTSSPDAVIGIGSTPSIDLTLSRITRFDVTGPPNATVTIGATSKSAAQGTTIEFDPETTSTSATPLSATVSATGFRTRVVSVPNELLSTTPVTLLPNVTVSGNIAAPNGPITAKAPGMADVVGAITGGSYSIAGLGVDSAGLSKTWTISYDVPGGGLGSTTVAVTTTSATVVTGQNIPLDIRDVTYDFTVTRPASPSPTAVGSATVAILNDVGTLIDSRSTPADGRRTVTVKENTKPTTWRVSHPDFLTKSGPVSPLTAALDEDLAVLLQPAIQGVVFNSATPAVPVPGATVAVCPSTALTPCVPTQPDRSTPSGPGGAFKLNSDLPPGPYTLWASTSTQRGSITFTIEANGAATLPSGTISIN